MIRLVRSSRWRKAIVAACLPYVLLSVLVNFVHAHQADVDSAIALAGPAVVSGEAQCTARIPVSPCAVCQWLRSGPRLQPRVTIDPEAHALASILLLQPAPQQAPDLCSVALRGPPALFS